MIIRNSPTPHRSIKQPAALVIKYRRKIGPAFPDIKDYPDHDACVSCHRPQFFKGARPPICSVCHSKTSPRDEARFAFRNPASKLQFTIEFPHDRHQDVIASCGSHTHSRAITTAPSATRRGPQPSRRHQRITRRVSTVIGRRNSRSPPTATVVTSLRRHTCRTEPTRISIKYLHEGGGEKKQHVAECTTCHINITKAASLRGLKPDVPITACTECHNKDGLRQDLNTELVALDKNRNFTCVYCHAPNVGNLDPPASHYLIAERPPLKRKDIR